MPTGRSSGFIETLGGQTHGFVRRGETYASIDFPGAAWTNARGIGPSGDVLGAYRMPGEPDVNQHGYRLARDGQFSRIDFPGHISTVPVRLLPDGTIVGCYHDAAGMDSMHGMTLVKNTFGGFDRAMTMHEGATPDGKTIVGYFTEMTDMKRNRGYVLEGTNFTPFDVPGSVSTTAIDISASGAIVGVLRSSGREDSRLRSGRLAVRHARCSWMQGIRAPGESMQPGPSWARLSTPAE